MTIEAQQRRAARTFADIRKPATPSEEQVKAKLFLDELTHRVLDTPDGQRLREHWRSITIERRNGPEASDGALRELEAQRRFVSHEIEGRISDHLELRTKGST